MLLSLIYNRGASMANKDSRREMRNIRGAVAEAGLGLIAAELRSMKRLWSSDELPGLLKRRDKEADIILASDHEYGPSELRML